MLFYIAFSEKVSLFVTKITSFFLSDIIGKVKSLFLFLFFLACVPIIVYHSHLFLNSIPNHSKGHSGLIYEVNLFSKNFDDFNIKIFFDNFDDFNFKLSLSVLLS